MPLKGPKGHSYASWYGKADFPMGPSVLAGTPGGRKPTGPCSKFHSCMVDVRLRCIKDSDCRRRVIVLGRKDGLMAENGDEEHV